MKNLIDMWEIAVLHADENDEKIAEANIIDNMVESIVELYKAKRLCGMETTYLEYTMEMAIENVSAYTREKMKKALAKKKATMV